MCIRDSLYMGCEPEFDPGFNCNESGVFVGGSGFPETDYDNNRTFVVTSLGTPCAAGRFSATGTEPCDPAPAGTFVATEGATEATPCPLGTYQPDGGTTSCLRADIGSYVDQAGSTTQTSCPAGTSTAAAGSTAADDCLPDFDGDGQPDSIDPDDDGDDVLDDADVCPFTDLASDDAPSDLKKNRFWSDVAGTFGDSGFTVADTGGCSAGQIIEAAGLGQGHTRFGLTKSALEAWAASL